MTAKVVTMMSRSSVGFRVHTFPARLL